MSDYYDIDKPFSRNNWNKLISDINDEVTNPPGDCSALTPLDEVDPEHIWTKEDVEDVRDKLQEMCPDSTFEEDLSKPWRKSVIDELEDKMVWCGCGIDEYTLNTKDYALGTCTQDRILCETLTTPLSTYIDGLVVGRVNYKWYTYQVILIDHSTVNDATFVSNKAAYDAASSPGDPPYEATWQGYTCCGQTHLTGGYIWCDGTIHSTSAVGISDCLYNYINYTCLSNPGGSPIIDAANAAYKAVAEQQVADYQAAGKWTETVLRVFSHQAVKCVPGDPYYQS